MVCCVSWIGTDPVGSISSRVGSRPERASVSLTLSGIRPRLNCNAEILTMIVSGGKPVSSAALAADGIGFSHAGFEAFRHRHRQVVANMVAEAVVPGVKLAGVPDVLRKSG